MVNEPSIFEPLKFYCISIDNQKWIFNTKGQHSVGTESRVMVLFLCTLSDDVLYLYQVFKMWRRHEILSFELQPLSVTLTYVGHR